MIDTTKANRIYEAIVANTTETGQFLTMGHIRDEVSGIVTRQEFDALMVGMVKLGILAMVPEENQKVLNGADAYNAVELGGVACHLVALAS